ncbi:DUF805 domain-containing protein [Sinomonas sp. G460-2]|uniref:DUF805 domain-containing protein n=1 Tax=Sinomonas sp. G460-2 TaxID=3393464 RepID=UPI0039EF1E42
MSDRQYQQGQADPTTAGEPPAWAPFYGANPVQAVRRFFTKYAVFHGRASRPEYWWVALAFAIVWIVVEVLAFALGGGSRDSVSGPGFAVLSYVLLALFLGTIVPNLSLTARRLHDANLSGWFLLLGLVPLVGGIAVFVFTVLPPNPAGQRFDRPEISRPVDSGR